MNAIVYTSNSGFTERYADLLAAETGLPVYALGKAAGSLSAGAEIIYMGWLMAGSIKGYEKAAKNYSVRAVCAVGMVRPSEQVVAGIRKKHQIQNAEVFYLQGGFDMEKLHGMYKLMVKTMAKTVGKKLEKQADKSAEEEEILGMLQNGGDMVSIENLSGVLAWYHAQTDR